MKQIAAIPGKLWPVFVAMTLVLCGCGQETNDPSAADKALQELQAKYDELVKDQLDGSTKWAADDLESWANLVECREDIDYSACAHAIHVMANPVLEGPITPELARQLLPRSRSKR